MSTRAIRFLKTQNVAFDVKMYDHREKGAVFASEALGFPVERTIKTLVVDLGGKRHCLALMPGDRRPPVAMPVPALRDCLDERPYRDTSPLA